MSTLGDAVTARDTANRLVALTNSTESPTTVNTTTLGLAVTDITARFGRLAGVTFDATDAQHLEVGIQGVWAILASWKGQEGGQGQLDRFDRACEDYRAKGPNKRIQPRADRTLGPSPDVNADGTARRPEFDRSRFDRLDIVPPPGTP